MEGFGPTANAINVQFHQITWIVGFKVQLKWKVEQVIIANDLYVAYACCIFRIINRWLADGLNFISKTNGFVQLREKHW